MKPASPAILAAHKPPEPSPAPTVHPDDPKSGAAAQTTTAPPVKLEDDGSYVLLYTVDPMIVRRLLTRTGRATREQMLAELPRYVERIVKRALENEVY